MSDQRFQRIRMAVFLLMLFGFAGFYSVSNASSSPQPRQSSQAIKPAPPPPPPPPAYTFWKPGKQRVYVHDVVKNGFRPPAKWNRQLGWFAGQVPSLHDICVIFADVGDRSSVPFILVTLESFPENGDLEAFNHCTQALRDLTKAQIPMPPDRLTRASISAYVATARRIIGSKR